MTDLLERAALARVSSRGSSPAAASPTATCSAPARAGPSRSCSTPRRARSSSASSAAADTFALGDLQRLPDVRRAARASSPAPRTGRASCRTAASSTRRASRWSRCCESPSVLLAGMEGSVLPIAVSHGEGRAEFASPEAAAACAQSGLVGVRYIHHDRSVASTYPANPSGTPVWHRGALQRRWPRHHHHAAPGALVPLRAELLAPA